MSNKENNVPHAGSMWENWETYENKAPAIKMLLNLLEKFLLPRKQILFPHQCFSRWTNRKRLTGNVTFPQQCFLVYPRLKIKAK